MKILNEILMFAINDEKYICSLHVFFVGKIVIILVADYKWWILELKKIRIKCWIVNGENWVGYILCLISIT